MRSEPRPERIAVAAELPPSAEEAVGVTTPRRQDVVTPQSQTRAACGRTVFTWRLTADQALALHEMTLRLKRQLGRAKLDKAEMLEALVGLAEENSAVFGALVARTQEGQTPRCRDVWVGRIRAVLSYTSHLHPG